MAEITRTTKPYTTSTRKQNTKQTPSHQKPHQKTITVVHKRPDKFHLCYHKSTSLEYPNQISLLLLSRLVVRTAMSIVLPLDLLATADPGAPGESWLRPRRGPKDTWSLGPGRIYALPFNTFGGTTSKGAHVLHRLSRLYAENTTSKHTRGERVALFWQGLQVTLLTQIAGQLRTSTYTGPQGPVLPIYYPTDSWGNLLPTSGASQPANRPRVVRSNRVDGQHQPYPLILA